MPDAFQIFLSGAALGFSIAAPPGPVTALSAERVVSRSWSAGWLVMLGATAADGVFFVLTYYGVARLVTASERGVLFLVGGALMLYLALTIVRRAVRLPAGSLPSSGRWSSSSVRRFPFLLGLSVGLTSPFQLGWWVAVGAGMVSEYGVNVAAGFFVGILAWTLAFTALVHSGVRKYQRLAPAIAYGSAAIMVGFAAWFLVEGLLTAFA